MPRPGIATPRRKAPLPLPSASRLSDGRQATLQRLSARYMEPSYRKLAGIGLILLLIAMWAALVASLARVVGAWPVIVQAPFYLVMGLAWIIPLKPLVRWMQTGSFRSPR